MKSFKYKGVTYKVGDKVLLTNKRPSNWNTDELMDKYLGRVVTISNIVNILYPNRETYFLIEEETFCTFEPENIVKKISGTFFKKLPNNFTGTIDVVNGYIGKPEILDEEEKRYLEGVIRPFRDKVEYIQKIASWEREFITIQLESEYINLPYFSANTMYKGMKQGEEYTLEELGLFEEE